MQNSEQNKFLTTSVLFGSRLFSAKESRSLWTPWLVALLFSFCVLLFEQAGGSLIMRSAAFRASQPSLESTRIIRLLAKKAEYQVLFWREGGQRLAQLEHDYAGIQIDAQLLRDLQHENEVLRKELSLRSSQLQMARWYGSVNQWFIDRGCKQGVRSGEAVTLEGALVGVIDEVFSDYSTVQTWTDTAWRMPVQIGTESARGVFTSQEGYLAVTEVPTQVAVKEGDGISTAGHGLLIADVPIGSVQSILLIPGMGTQEITVKPYFQPGSFEWVHIQRTSGEATCN